MKSSTIDVRVAFLTLALLGCPKKAANEATGAANEDDGMSAMMASDADDVEGAGGAASEPGGGGASAMNQDTPDDPDATGSGSQGGSASTPLEPPMVTWQGVRQDGVDINHNIASVDADATGAVFIGGNAQGPFQETDYASWSLLVAKYGADGVLAWTWTEDALTGRGAVASVSGDDRGNVYLAGRTGAALGDQTLLGETDAFAGKLDAAGDLLWVRHLGTAASDEASASLADSAGNLLVAGYAGGALPDQRDANVTSGAFITKLGPDGSHLWTRRHSYRLAQLSGDSSNAVYAGEEGSAVLKLDADGNTLWTSDIDEQSEIGDDLDDPKGEYSGALLEVMTAADRDGTALFVAGGYGGIGYQSTIYGFLGRMDPTTGELGWIVGVDSQVLGVATSPDGSAVFITTIYDTVAFDANGDELWRAPMLTGDALVAGVTGDLFLAGNVALSNITGTPGSGITSARDWFVARLRQSDGGRL